MNKFSFNQTTSFTKSFSALMLVLFFYCIVPLRGFAQTSDQSFPKLTLNTAVGLGSNLAVSNSTITVPPISLSLDIKILPKVTIGPYIAYEKNSYYG